MPDLDFTFLEMNPFTLVDGKPYPLDMRGELDDTAAFKNFKKYTPIFSSTSVVFVNILDDSISLIYMLTGPFTSDMALPLQVG